MQRDYRTMKGAEQTVSAKSITNFVSMSFLSSLLFKLKQIPSHLAAFIFAITIIFRTLNQNANVMKNWKKFFGNTKQKKITIKSRKKAITKR